MQHLDRNKQSLNHYTCNKISKCEGKITYSHCPLVDFPFLSALTSRFSFPPTKWFLVFLLNLMAFQHSSSEVQQLSTKGLDVVVLGENIQLMSQCNMLCRALVHAGAKIQNIQFIYMLCQRIVYIQNIYAMPTYSLFYFLQKIIFVWSLAKLI